MHICTLILCVALECRDVTPRHAPPRNRRFGIVYISCSKHRTSLRVTSTSPQDSCPPFTNNTNDNNNKNNNNNNNNNNNCSNNNDNNNDDNNNNNNDSDVPALLRTYAHFSPRRGPLAPCALTRIEARVRAHFAHSHVCTLICFPPFSSASRYSGSVEM